VTAKQLRNRIEKLSRQVEKLPDGPIVQDNGPIAELFRQIDEVGPLDLSTESPMTIEELFQSFGEMLSENAETDEDLSLLAYLMTPYVTASGEM
jgi:hypothetical protein